MAYKNPEDQKAYARAHYQANKAVYAARARAHTTKQRRLIREYVNMVKSVECMDCERYYGPHIMDFDHRPDEEKSFTIGAALSEGYPLRAVQEEIKKCDVVCANCHRERTFQRRVAKQEEIVYSAGSAVEQPGSS